MYCSVKDYENPAASKEECESGNVSLITLMKGFCGIHIRMCS